MGLSKEEESAGYSDLHATVVDAIRYITAGQSLEEAADEVLQRATGNGSTDPRRSVVVAAKPCAGQVP